MDGRRPARAVLARLLVPILAAAAGVVQSQDASRGETLYGERCGACHSVDANRVGPAHRGVFGRVAGSLADYDYSPALKNARMTWNEQTLDAWLAAPESLVPGQRMGYAVSDPADRRDLIAYLRTVSGR